MVDDPNAALFQVLDLLESLGIRHHLGGSYASSLHGAPRQTRDADVVADLSSAHIEVMIDRLADEFYTPEHAMREAIGTAGCFNLIHFDSGFKVDIFVAGRDPFDRLELERSVPMVLVAEASRQVMVKSPEDTILRKLSWFREGGEVSHRQLDDVRRVISVQGAGLDRTYLKHWAAVLGVSDLVDRLLPPS